MSPQDLINVRFFTDFPHCNAKCAYCIAGHGQQQEASEVWDAERYRAIIANLCCLDFHINIRIGMSGEFFVSKPLIEGALRLSHAQCVKGLNLITNLLLPFEKYRDVLAPFATKKLAIVASCHPSEITNMDEWISTARKMADRYDLMTMFVAYPPHLAELPALKWRLEAAGLETFVQPYIGIYNGRSYPEHYTEDERKLIRGMMYSRHDTEYLLDLKQPGLCFAGSKFIFVDPVGRVYPCGGAHHCQQIGDLAHSPVVVLGDSPVQCPAKTCQCDTENVNTVDFSMNYELSGLNQHRYRSCKIPQ